MSGRLRGSVSISELRALGVEVPPGADLELIRDRVQARAIRVVTSPREQFDRSVFDRLMGAWEALQPEPEEAVDAG